MNTKTDDEQIQTADAGARRDFLRRAAGVGLLMLGDGAVRADAAATSDSGSGTHAMGRYRIVAEGLAMPEAPVAMSDGSVLVGEMLEGHMTRVLPDGKLVPLPNVGGAPNGAAIGPDGACYIANNGGFNKVRGPDGKLELRPGLPPDYMGGSIQRLDLKTGAFKTLYTHAGERMLRGPNDLVFDASGGFYFSDIGKAANPDSLELGAIFWARPDGSEIRPLAERLMGPNGMALSPDGRTLYVVLTFARQVLAYNVVAPGKLEMASNGQPRRRVLVSVGGEAVFDSMKVERNGNLVVATGQVGCLSVFSPADGALLDQVYVPDPGVTNLVFGGSNLQTAYVTLARTGRLAAVPWPRPGLRLQFQ